MKFYPTKEVWIELGISSVTLYKRIELGHYPPLQTGGKRKGGKGYYEDILNIVKTIQTPKNGRPKKTNGKPSKPIAVDKQNN